MLTLCFTDLLNPNLTEGQVGAISKFLVCFTTNPGPVSSLSFSNSTLTKQ